MQFEAVVSMQLIETELICSGLSFNPLGFWKYATVSVTDHPHWWVKVFVWVWSDPSLLTKYKNDQLDHLL